MRDKQQEFTDALRAALGRKNEEFNNAPPICLFFAIFERGIICNDYILDKIRKLCFNSENFNVRDADEVIRYINHYLPKEKA